MPHNSHLPCTSDFMLLKVIQEGIDVPVLAVSVAADSLSPGLAAAPLAPHVVVEYTL